MAGIFKNLKTNLSEEQIMGSNASPAIIAHNESTWAHKYIFFLSGHF